MKPIDPRFLRFPLFVFVVFWGAALVAQNTASPFYDFHAESPGTIHKVTVADLPAPFASKSAAGFPIPFPRPTGAIPKVLPGFKVELYATGLDNPRELRTAPNGDVFAAEMHNGEIEVFRGVTKDGKAEQTATFVKRAEAAVRDRDSIRWGRIRSGFTSPTPMP